MDTDDRARLIHLARDWIAGDPDPETRAELQELVDAGDADALAERVDGTLAFGTAGLRGIVGAGPRRMNRAVVIRTTRGLADHLAAAGAHADAPVVVGYDGRTDSRRFAEDVVGVLHAAGRAVLVFTRPIPTPLVAYAARVHDAAAAVVVTASHNPPAYNGYKVYAGNAVQIIPPTDAAIAAAIDAVGPATGVPRTADPFHADRVIRLGDETVERYLTEVLDARPAAASAAGPSGLRIVYTPLHGVGRQVAVPALARAGHTDVHVVAAQAEPDGAFPTVAFPNPEEPGALDLALDLAGEVDADLVLANDPDADRLAVCVPDGDGWRALTGNQIGVLLGGYLLDAAPGDVTPLTVSSIVSSPMLGDVTRAHAGRHEVTLTGFKWICNAALEVAATTGTTFVFGYEEALGYTVGTTVRDKDGISAAVAFADLAADCARRGITVLDRLAELARTHGLWVSHQSSVAADPNVGMEALHAAMQRLGPDRHPDELAGLAVTGVSDFRTGGPARPRWLPDAELVALELTGGSRVLVRPSGTEPKLKIYVDLRASLTADDDLADHEQRLRQRGQQVADALAAFVGIA